MNAGQICMSVDRVIVDRSIAEEFSSRFAEKVAKLPTGDPMNQATVIGPQVSQGSADRQYALIDDAVSKGAKVLAGGEKAGQAVVPATVLAGITEEMRVYDEEIFGSATTVMEVDGPEQAVKLANDTNYGLTSGVITENLAEGH